VPLIRVREPGKNQVPSAICREGTVLLPVHPNHIRFQAKVVPEAAEVILQEALHMVVDHPGQEVHILPDLLPQVHPEAEEDLHPLLILREVEGNSIDIWFFLNSSFYIWSAGIVYQKMIKL
jgi:hypothetical protein